MLDINIKNYTSIVSKEKSIANIEKLLVQAGANHISKIYENNEIKGLFFQLIIDNNPFTFRLPSQSENIYIMLKNNIKKPRKNTFKNINEQSERIAWKILKEWIHIQLSFIKLKQIEPLQAFLSYLYDFNKQLTFYDTLKQNNFKFLLNSRKINEE